MGKIFYIMGKSASGKDTIYKELIEKMPKFHSIVPYTTRPLRVRALCKTIFLTLNHILVSKIYFIFYNVCCDTPNR